MKKIILLIFLAALSSCSFELEPYSGIRYYPDYYWRSGMPYYYPYQFYNTPRPYYIPPPRPYYNPRPYHYGPRPQGPGNNTPRPPRPGRR